MRGKRVLAVAMLLLSFSLLIPVALGGMEKDLKTTEDKHMVGRGGEIYFRRGINVEHLGNVTWLTYAENYSSNPGVATPRSNLHSLWEDAKEPLPRNHSIRFTDFALHISLTSNPAILSADGISRAKITATVTNETGSPSEGLKVCFSVESGGGALLSSYNYTNNNGKASVIYQAGSLPRNAIINATTHTIWNTTKINLTNLSVVDWTFMVYLDADNDLNDCGLDDLNEMEYAPNSSEVNTIVLFDGSTREDYPSPESRIYKIAHDPNGYSDQSYGGIISPVVEDNQAVIPASGEVNMADPETLRKFINWTINTYPAHHYALVLWDHGDTALGGFCQDSTSNYKWMTLPELKYALSGFALDLLSFDACVMAQAETAYQVKNYTQYLLASESLVPEDGLDYQHTLKFLVNNPNASGEELGGRAISNYINSYKNGTQTPDTSVTLSLINLSALPAFIEKLDDFSRELYLRTYGYLEEIREVRNMVEDYYHSYHVDLYHFTSLINHTSALPTCSQARAEDLLNIYPTVVIRHGHHNFYLAGDFIEVGNSSGMAIYFPPSRYQGKYEQLDFAELEWDEFISMYLKPTRPYGVRVGGGENEKTVIPGNSTTYLIQVENIGNNSDIINLTFSSPPSGWLVEMSNYSVMLSPHECVNITLTVRAPSEISDAEILTFNITAKSTHDELQRDCVELRVRINIPPTCTITYPEEESILSDTVVIKGNASDKDGEVEYIQISITHTGIGWFNATSTDNYWTSNWSTKYVAHGNFTILARAWDGINYSSICSVGVSVDNEEPKIEVEITGEKHNQWYCSEVLVEVLYRDWSGTDIKKYNLTRWQSYTQPFLVGEGMHMLEFYAQDLAGNKARKNLTLQVDLSQPQVWLSLPLRTSSKSFTVCWGAHDELSGIAWYEIEYCKDEQRWVKWKNTTESLSEFTGTYGTYKLRIRATDVAGNTCEWEEYEVKIKEKKPFIPGFELSLLIFVFFLSLKPVGFFNKRCFVE